MRSLRAVAVLAAVLCSGGVAAGDVRLPAIFGDHMVLQGGAKLPVWGTADAGEIVTVRIAGQEKAATADEGGTWRVVLDPIATGENPQGVEMSVTGKGNSITLKDVLVGEVWLCSGQSNMGFKLARASNAKEAVAAAGRPMMRLFTVGRDVRPDGPAHEGAGQWVVCTPDTAKAFSAVAYFFGAALQEKLGGAPVGLIDASWGGTRAEAWLPRERFDALKLPYEPAWTKQWLEPEQKPGAKKPEPARPHQAPAGLYNGMIAPLAGYGMRGAVWYQGETNTAYPAEYRDVLAALVTGWRDAWGRTAGGSADAGPQAFPFLVVQLPNFLGRSRDWATMRDSQARVARELPNVGMAVTIDLGDPKDIHPTNKQPVGERLALLAERMAYGREVADSGPAFQSVRVNGSEAVVAFDHVHGGLVARGGELLGFEVAGADGRFVPAAAKVEGDTVIVRAEGVAAPTAVRYAWANNPTCTLYNKAGLPAAPFLAAVK